jgi:hypothetical protein
MKAAWFPAPCASSPYFLVTLTFLLAIGITAAFFGDLQLRTCHPEQSEGSAFPGLFPAAC